MGLAAPERKAAEHGHAPRPKDGRLRQPDAVAVALEEPGNADPLGMVTAEAGMGSTDLLERVGEPSGRQLVRREPPPEIGKRTRERRKGDADQAEPYERAGATEARRRGFHCSFAIDGHLPPRSNRAVRRRSGRVQRSFREV